MDPCMDVVWIPEWILAWNQCGSLYMDPIRILVLILDGSLYESYMDPFMDPIWIPYGSLYGSYMYPYMDPGEQQTRITRDKRCELTFERGRMVSN